MAGVALSESTARKLAEMIREWEGRKRKLPSRQGKAKYFTATVLPARTGGTAIPAATVSGTITTYGSGSATLERDTGNTLVADGDSVTVYNRLQEAIPAATAITVGWWGGKLWVLGYECSS